MRLLILFSMLITLTGCMSNWTIPYSGPTLKTGVQPVPSVIAPNFRKGDTVFHDFHKSLALSHQLWFEEVQTRFNNPVMVVGHGSFENNEWIIRPDRGGPWRVRELAQAYSHAYPDRDIVLVICNPGGVRINVPRVWYFTTMVWSEPDRSVIDLNKVLGFLKNSGREVERGKGDAGSIWEAVTQ